MAAACAGGCPCRCQGAGARAGCAAHPGGTPGTGRRGASAPPRVGASGRASPPGMARVAAILRRVGGVWRGLSVSWPGPDGPDEPDPGAGSALVPRPARRLVGSVPRAGLAWPGLAIGSGARVVTFRSICRDVFTLNKTVSAKMYLPLIRNGSFLMLLLRKENGN